MNIQGNDGNYSRDNNIENETILCKIIDNCLLLGQEQNAGRIAKYF
jgi:hypothetical protein